VHCHPLSKEADLIFTLIDLEELIENYGVKAVVEEMNQSLIDKLNEGLRAYYIKKANERLNEKPTSRL